MSVAQTRLKRRKAVDKYRIQPLVYDYNVEICIDPLLGAISMFILSVGYYFFNVNNKASGASVTKTVSTNLKESKKRLSKAERNTFEIISRFIL